ncbi:uncharacterized protein haspin isoform X2 [Channa argus]|uniref:uncharacterized protein haspin isoform X2 n=1 Tax=Channa argus TaxID=215402 RepID=UPI00352099E1
MKPLFLKTYGKKKRKLSAWISPENRKRAFDSTLSSDGDSSGFERAKPTRTSRSKRASIACRASRPAKKKAMQFLTESSFDDENIRKEENVIILSPPCPPPAQESKRRRGKKTNVCSGRGVRLVKRKTECLTLNSSDEENISIPCPPRRQPAQRRKITRKRQLALDAATPDQQLPMTSDREKESMSAQKVDRNLSMKKYSNVHPPSVGRFVTRRRRAFADKPQRPKARVTSLNSSNEFSSGALGSSRILRPSKRKRLPLTYIVSSAENSINAAGTSSFATNPLREISLSGLSDQSLGPCTRQPIFCSTPSADPFSKRPHLRPLHMNDPSSSPLSMYVGCIGVLSPFQEDIDSPQQPIASLHSASPTGLHFQEKPQLDLFKTTDPVLHHLEEHSVDLFRESKSTNERITCSEDAKSITDDTKTKSSGESRHTVLLSEDSESSSYFVSAAGGLEWLIEALKEKCLTEHCTVQLERFDILTVTQLCSQITYSSCLGEEQSPQSQQSNEHAVSVNSGQTDDFQSSQALFNLCLSVTNKKNSAYLLSDNSFDSPQQAASVKKCTIQLKKLALSQLPTEQHTGLTQQKGSCDDRSDNAGAKQAENDHTHNLDSPDDLASIKQPNNSSRVAQTQFEDPEIKKALLKNKCLTNKLSIDINRVTLSELKEILKLRNTKMKLPTAEPDSQSDDQTNGGHQSKKENDRDNKDSFSMKVNMSKRSSTSSEEKIPTDKEALTTSCVPKRKKMPLAPKEKQRRSTSADRPGTTRKACVSGLSVSRWKNKGSASTHMFRRQTEQSGGVKAVDSSINELISTQHKQPTELGAAMNFTTPVKTSPLNFSSLLADLTPNTYTWSRLKAAISVHRKVLLTPRTPTVSKYSEMANLDISQDLFTTPLRTLLPKHLRSQLLRHDSLVACENADLSDAEKVYLECGQQCPLPWEECILPQRMKKCVKIGEGTFGEVFSTTNASGDTVALKIIPVEGSKKVNEEDQKTFGEILHEIIISKELSSLKEKQQNQTCGFIGLNDLHCVQGCYPPEFLKAWDRFDQRKGSENDRPDFFEKDQLFIILEFEFGGIDLENSNGTLASLGVAKTILHQVTAALAVAEQELHFEHRDLHWGNVLVKTTKEKTGSFLLNGTAHSLETKGVLVRIIDYSLSRLEIDELTVSCDISKDEELFMGQGDYQFEIYRMMRKENGNNWTDYHPHTNVLWLHYLCSKLLSMKYRGSRGKGVKNLREELTRFYDNILQYSSATEALQNCPMFQ